MILESGLLFGANLYRVTATSFCLLRLGWWL